MNFSFGRKSVSHESEIGKFSTGKHKFSMPVWLKKHEKRVKGIGIINHEAKWKHVSRSHANYGCEASDMSV